MFMGDPSLAASIKEDLRTRAWPRLQGHFKRADFVPLKKILVRDIGVNPRSDYAKLGVYTRWGVALIE